MDGTRNRPVEGPIHLVRVLGALALGGWLLVGCRMPPPLTLETEYGLVRAHTDRELDWLESGLGAVREVEKLMGARVEPPGEWWVQDTPFLERAILNWSRGGGVLAANYRGRIEFGEMCFWNPSYFVAHEYAHWVMKRVQPYPNLPYFMEEGLANWVAQQVTGWNIDTSRGFRDAPVVQLDARRLPRTSFGWNSLKDEDLGKARVLTIMLVDTLGLDRLRELADADASRMDYLHAAAEASDRISLNESGGDEGSAD